MGHDWALGVVVNLCGCTTLNAGTNIMKKGLLNPVGKSGSSLVWYVGCGLYVLGNSLNFISFGLAPQSLLASVNAIQFVTNVFFAHWILGEEVTRRTGFATALLVMGVAICASSASHANRRFTAKLLVELYANLSYIIFLVLEAVAVVLLELLFRRSRLQAPYRPVCYSAVACIVGTQATVQAKCLSELLLSGFKAIGNSSYIAFLLIVIAVMVISQVFFLRRLHAALGLFDATVIIPLLQVFWTAFSILAGGLYFQEFAHLTPLHIVAFAVGLVLLFTGVYFLLPVSSTDDKEGIRNNIAETQDSSERNHLPLALFFGPGAMDYSQLRMAADNGRRNTADMVLDSTPRRGIELGTPGFTRRSSL